MDDGVVGAQVGGGGVVADHALLHDVDAVRGLEGQRHILLHEEDGHAVAVQDVDDLVDLRDHARHEPFRRLVEENDLGLEHHGPRDGQHLLLPARQRAPRLAAPLSEHGEGGVHLVEQILPLGVGDSRAVEPRAEVLHHAQQLEDAPVLGHPGDAQVRHVVGGHAADLAPLEADVAFRGTHKAHHRLERGALADPVAAEQPYYFARTDLDRYPVEDVGLAVVSVDVVQDEHQVFRYTSWTRGFAWIWAGVPAASSSSSARRPTASSTARERSIRSGNESRWRSMFHAWWRD